MTEHFGPTAVKLCHFHFVFEICSALTLIIPPRPSSFPFQGKLEKELNKGIQKVSRENLQTAHKNSHINNETDFAI